MPTIRAITTLAIATKTHVTTIAVSKRKRFTMTPRL